MISSSRWSCNEGIEASSRARLLSDCRSWGLSNNNGPTITICITDAAFLVKISARLGRSLRFFSQIGPILYQWANQFLAGTLASKGFLGSTLNVFRIGATSVLPKVRIAFIWGLKNSPTISPHILEYLCRLCDTLFNGFLRCNSCKPIPRAAMLPCPNQDLQVPFPSGMLTRRFVPLAAVLVRPHQHVQVPSPSGICTRRFVPWAAMLVRPYQHVQVPSLSGICTHLPVPLVAMLPCPQQHLQVPSPSGSGTRRLVPRTAVLPRPNQHLQVPSPSGEC